MKVTIIGGGIAGLSSAWFLAADGWDVTVLEKGDLSDNCSFGNMGYLSPSHFVPLAQPGIISQGIWWMFDVKSPFYVRPSLNPDLLNWGWKFMRAGTQRHVDRSARPLTELLLFSKHLTAEWQHSGQMSFEYTEDGCIMYYQTAKKEEEELENARIAVDLGLKTAVIDREQAQLIEPDMRPDVRGGVWFKDDAHLHPNSLMRQLPLLLEQRGVRIVRNAEVTGFSKEGKNIRSIRYRDALGDQQIMESDLVVLAAGSWSPQIAKMAGENLPLMPGKGYSMTVDTDRQRFVFPAFCWKRRWPSRPGHRACALEARWKSAPSTTASCFPGCRASSKPCRGSCPDTGTIPFSAHSQTWNN